ncbi:hypothetical protein COHA_001043, partial [Chlorella ohadii]
MHHPPSHTGAVVLPRYIEDERDYGGRSVHTVVLFPSPGGWGQATALRLQLEDSAAKLFDIATFGSVYVRAVSAAYMAVASGANYAPATLPAHSKASAMFSLAWPKDRAPAWVGGAQVQAFVAAVKARLPDAVIHVVRHFGKLEAEGLAGIRLVPLAGYTAPAACQADPQTPPVRPVVAQHTATGPTTATVTVQPPPGTGWVRYELTVYPQGGQTSDCRKVPCTTPQACALTGLTPSTKYDVTAVAFKADNSPSLDSKSVTVTTSACPTGQVRCGSACIRSNTCCKGDSTARSPAAASASVRPPNVKEITYYSLREGAGGLLSFDFFGQDTVACSDATVALSSCLDPAKPVPCGSSCIGYGQCCKTNPALGEKCPAATECLADGATCTCKGDATKKLCNGVCIPAGTCCASDPKAGTPCSYNSYTPEQTCSGDGGSCTANTDAVCGYNYLTSFKLESVCTPSSPTSAYQGCWAPPHRNNAELVPFKSNSIATLWSDVCFGYNSVKDVRPTTQKGRVGVQLWINDVTEWGNPQSPAGTTPMYAAAWQSYTDANGRAVVAPRKVLNGSTADSAVLNLASTPSAYVRAKIQTIYKWLPNLLSWNYDTPTTMMAVTGLRQGTGGALGTRLYITSGSFAKLAYNPSEVQASYAYFVGYSCTMLTPLVPSPGPVYIVNNVDFTGDPMTELIVEHQGPGDAAIS